MGRLSKARYLHITTAGSQRRQISRPGVNSRPMRFATFILISLKSGPLKASLYLHVAIDHMSKFAFIQKIRNAGLPAQCGFRPRPSDTCALNHPGFAGGSNFERVEPL